jgi:hypothetical protein
MGVKVAQIEEDCHNHFYGLSPLRLRKLTQRHLMFHQRQVNWPGEFPRIMKRTIFIFTAAAFTAGAVILAQQTPTPAVAPAPVPAAAGAPVPAPAPPAATPAPPATPATPPAVPEATKQNLPKKDKQRKAADEFFSGPIVYLEFEFKPEEWEYIKKDHRRYAECVVTETAPDGKKTVFKNTAVKLKGAAGSFQGPDGKPGLTISMDKFKGATRFHGMEKFHLNNGAQDGSLLNEFIGGEWCRASGVPCIALHARDREMAGPGPGALPFEGVFHGGFPVVLL